MICTFRAFKDDGNNFNIGARYIDVDYTPVAVRVYAEQAPDVEDARFDIYVGGVSIFPDRARDTLYPAGGVAVKATEVKTYMMLTKDTNSEDIMDDFSGEPMEKDNWITCNLLRDGGGRNFTIQLELAPIE